MCYIKIKSDYDDRLFVQNLSTYNYISITVGTTTFCVCLSVCLTDPNDDPFCIISQYMLLVFVGCGGTHKNITGSIFSTLVDNVAGVCLTYLKMYTRDAFQFKIGCVCVYVLDVRMYYR